MNNPACAGKWALFDSTRVSDHKKARAICRTCPELMKCIEVREAELSRPYGGNGSGPQGTWAGQLIGSAKLPGRPPKCGTESAYHRHRHFGETCDECKRAHAVAEKQRYAQRKQAKALERAS